MTLPVLILTIILSLLKYIGYLSSNRCSELDYQ